MAAPSRRRRSGQKPPLGWRGAGATSPGAGPRDSRGLRHPSWGEAAQRVGVPVAESCVHAPVTRNAERYPNTPSLPKRGAGRPINKEAATEPHTRRRPPGLAIQCPGGEIPTLSRRITLDPRGTRRDRRWPGANGARSRARREQSGVSRALRRTPAAAVLRPCG
ncbi:hypothetical protein NDU88_000323 [Pleurodeles waltl]|uniref:Uncharacterized protein n=1 Tax=Pleurodeles waltl TaxID=8319 RepID=A0AAV7KPY9_PLEWA|nr:hypothetical protein NDU88_000323 [Pleurodeles waltl]